MLKNLTSILLCLCALAAFASAQSTETKPEQKTPPKKTNARPVNDSSALPKEPFEKASVAAMREQCVKLETEKGAIELELFPETAPESVRNFLNLISTGVFDTTTFSRIVPGFIIQGGNVATRLEKKSEFTVRARRTIPDEPGLIKHERGILSMARSDEPNSASSHFFILVSDAPHLNGTFAAFGRVIKGMETVDAINKMPVEGDTPTKPVRLTRAIVSPCLSQIQQTKP